MAAGRPLEGRLVPGLENPDGLAAVGFGTEHITIALNPGDIFAIRTNFQAALRALATGELFGLAEAAMAERSAEIIGLQPVITQKVQPLAIPGKAPLAFSSG